MVGFSQSEREANPFRIAETQSIRDEAKKVGVKKLLTTNAQSQLSKQISDIQDMLSQGAQFLIVAPLNSDGLEPALKAAAAKKVPVLTIDRKVNSTACKDYVAFLGSDFVEQGKRAADAMIKTTGGKGKVAILLGASGNNVTPTAPRDSSTRSRPRPPAWRSSPSRPASSPATRASRSWSSSSSPSPTSPPSTRRTTRWGSEPSPR